MVAVMLKENKTFHVERNEMINFQINMYLKMKYEYFTKNMLYAYIYVLNIV